VLNLFTVNWRFNLAEPMAEGPFPKTGLVEFLQAQPGTFRISSAGRLPGGASAGIVYQLEDITGNTPMRLDAFQRFEDQVESWRRWQLLNVRYVLSKRDLDGPGLERVYEEGKVKAYRMGDPLPRAWVVYSTVIADDNQVFDLLNAEDFDPRATAVLAADEVAPQLPGQSSPGGAVQIVEAQPGRLVLDVTLESDGLLVVSQPFYPGWQARVDGEKANIYRVDYLLQGVPVSAGSQRVEFSYHLSPLPLVVSLLVLVGCVIGLVLARRQV